MLTNLVWTTIGNPAIGVKRAFDGLYEMTVGPRDGNYSWYVRFPAPLSDGGVANVETAVVDHGVCGAERQAKREAADAVERQRDELSLRKARAKQARWSNRSPRRA